jgi:hypothetical protein
VSAAACANCSTALAGRYCHACGQDSQLPETAWASWREQWARLVRTVRTLLFAPGKLTLEHLAGARVRYIPPFTLFLNAIAVFFLFAVVTRFQLRDLVAQNPAWLGPIAEHYAAAAGLPVDAFIQRAERRFQGVYTLSLVIVSVVGYTLAYKAVFPRSLPGWHGPFTAGLHYIALIFVIALPWLMVTQLVAGSLPHSIRLFATPMPIMLAVVWNAFAARRFGGHGWPLAIAKGLAIVLAGFLIDGVMTYIAMQATFRLA